MKLATYIFLYFLFTSLKIKAFSQDYNSRIFSFNEGVSSYNIKKVLQDKYGFLWIATQDGLFRYDGVTFEPIKKKPGTRTSIRENFIFDITLGNDEWLYVSTFNGGVDAINIRTLEVKYLLSQRSKQKDGLPNLWITKLFLDSKENLWVGGKDYLTIYNEKSNLFHHVQVPAVAEINVSFIKSLDSLTIAVGVENYGILLFDQGSFKLISTIRHLDNMNQDEKIIVTDLVIDKNYCFISSGSVIYEGNFINATWKPRRKIELTETNSTINCLIPGLKNDLWIGTNSGVLLYDLERHEFSKKDKGNTYEEGNFIYDLFIDRNQALWISSLKNLERIDLHNNFFRAFTESRDGKIRMNHIYGMIYKDPSEIFACGTDGLYLCNLKTGIIKRIKGTEALGIIHRVLRINEDLWLISSDYGMHAYIPGKEIVSKELFLRLFPEWREFVNNYFNNALEADNKVYWASEEQEGLIVWDKERKIVNQFKAGTSFSHGLPENHLHNIKFDRQGFIWLLFDNNVARFDPKADTVMEVIAYKQNEKGFNSGIFFDVYDDGDVLWFGTYGGGINGYNKKTKSWTYITESVGLCNNSVYGILPENDSVFWASTNNGISRVNFRSKNCISYFVKDGLHDNSFDETGSLKSGNKLFFAGVNGFTQVDLEQYYNSTTAFPVYIKKVEYINKNKKTILNDLSWKELQLPAGTTTVSIWLSALSFSNTPAFSYKIRGYQADYLSTGNNNKIELNALSYGKYEIDIRYLSQKGEFIEGELAINIDILPFWYQTWWFRLLVILISLFFAFYTARLIYVSRLRKQKAILEKQIAIQIERQRISSEMHDDIGAGLSGIRLLTEMTKGKVKDAETGAEIDKIYRSLGDISAKMKEVIWSLNTDNDQLSSLISYIQRQIRQWLENYPCHLSISIPERIPEVVISGEARRNIFLTVKEAVHNIIKHSNADKVSIAISCDEQLKISVSDNGRGIEEGNNHDGNGLKNMKQRINKLNGTFSMKNQKGLTIFFEVPINQGL